MSIKKGKVRIIHWTDPDYLEKFYKGWGAGQSLTSRQAKSVKRSAEIPAADQQELPVPQQAPDPS